MNNYIEKIFDNNLVKESHNNILNSKVISHQVKKQFYSIKDIMTITGFSRSTIMRALKDERLKSRKVNGSRLIKITDFELFMEGDE